jgi:uncharacterized protein YqjF (DUF2071 family)
MDAFPTAARLPARLAEREAPTRSPVMFQRWRELLFLHWAVDPGWVAAQLPKGLRVDHFDGRAWMGVVPFLMEGVRPRGLPAVPALSNFPELNLRTYVIDQQGRPGVWFFSLDTPKRLPNWIARSFFNLNYRLARMRVATGGEGEWIDYRSELRLPNAWEPAQSFVWRRRGESRNAEPGSLEFFLVERYRLFAYDHAHGRIRTGKVNHPPYPLQDVDLKEYSTGTFTNNLFHAPERAPDSVLASPGVSVTVYPMEREPA